MLNLLAKKWDLVKRQFHQVLSQTGASITERKEAPMNPNVKNISPTHKMAFAGKPHQIAETLKAMTLKVGRKATMATVYKKIRNGEL